MRKIFIALALAFSVGLGGCQYAGKLAQFATVGIDNPITVQELAATEQSYLTLLKPTVKYLESRTCRTGEDELQSWTTLNPCGQYARKLVVQDALRTAQKYRRQLSEFVKNNRTLDARIAFAELNKAIGAMGAIPKAGAQ